MKTPKPQKPSLGQQIVASLQEFVEVLESGDKVEDLFVCRWVEAKEGSPRYTRETVQATRLLLRASQARFASLLGVAPRTVRAWEQGTSSPSEMASRFLDEIRYDPAYWRGRLRALSSSKAQASSRTVPPA
jgi:DNA-binding transcriptional regulator YiaG